MADWYGTSRSNYFRVKDPVEFEAWAKRIDAQPWQNPDGLWAIQGESDKGGWPCYGPDTDEDFDFIDELAKRVLPGDVVVLVSAGAEKLRYVSGITFAFRTTPEGVFEFEQISLDDIYQLAAERFGGDISEASY